MRALIEAWSRLPQPEKQVVFVFERLDPALRGACRTAGQGVRWALDPGGAAARTLNAGWRPRAYGVDGGRVVYVQAPETPDGAAPRAAAGLWAARDLRREVVGGPD